LNIFRVLWEDLKAFRRGERRIAPRSIHRGRVYARKDEDTNSGGFTFIAKREPKATLTMKITRADGTVEHIVVPATAHING
jgi:hypothetical protein